MPLEELAFSLERIANGLVRLNVTLPTVDDRNVAETKRDDATGKDVDNVSALVPGYATL